MVGTFETRVATPGVWSPPAAFEEYRLIEPLGSGAMGQVYLARDTLLDRLVAVKFIATSVRNDDPRYERFLVEARTIARLQHPNVVMIHRAGHVQHQPYLISEYIRGLPLDRIPRPVPWRRLLDIAIDLARGLGAAHRQGIVHRDIKPANAMVTHDGTAKLLDFGVAKLLDVPPAQASGEGQPPGVAPLGISRTGDLVGTPLYAAPEIWHREPATRRCDVYSLGVLLYELCTGRLPHGDASLDELRDLVTRTGLPALVELAPSVDLRFAAVVDRCLALDPARRFASGDAVRDALEAVLARPVPSLASDAAPYRGLGAFEAEHRDLFFARDADVRGVIERLRGGSFVLIAGDSGVGKSSLLAAGVLPALADGALDGFGRFTVIRLVPGRRPLAALAAALSPLCGTDDAALARELADDPAGAVRRVRRALAPAGRLALCIDQLEELVTLAGLAEAIKLADVLCEITSCGASELRLLAAVRADFLSRVARLSRLADELPRALYLLHPMEPGALREAVVGPARMLGWSFESEAMIDALVDGAAGSAPLLQFALAMLWQARDPVQKRIPAVALEALGGVPGALARHADAGLARLLPAQRTVARRVLSRLVTAEGTMRRCGEGELRGEPDDGEATRGVLDALVRSRLLVARAEDRSGETTYELIHEALLTAWGTLRDWLDSEVEVRAARQRIERAAADWERLGHARDALLHRGQLAEAAAVDEADLAPRERTFVRRSRAATRRRRALTIAGVLALPLTAVGVYAASGVLAARAQDRQISARLAEADEAGQQARSHDREVDQLRQDSFAAFDAGHAEAADALWTRALDADHQLASAHRRARQALESALVVDGTRRDLRRQFAELLYDGALAAERAHRVADLADLLERLRSSDLDGALMLRWQAPAHLTVRASPPETAIELQRYDDQDGRLRLSAPLTTSTGAIEDRILPPGSYLVTLRAPGRPAVRDPLLLRRNDHQRIELAIPAAIPDGFVYVPPGRSLFGSADDEVVRRNLMPAQPLHPFVTRAYLIERTEVSIRQWLEFLRSLPPAERERRRPRASNYFGSVELAQRPDGRWRFVFELPSRTVVFRLEEGQPLHLPERRRRVEQDWRDLPVTGISYSDAVAYAAWLARSGRVRGARLCEEHEWERAARGADGRNYPHGERLDPDDADIDVSYGQHTLAYGPDVVGSHPASDSPFDVADLVGNVGEWMQPAAGNPAPLYGSGDYYQDLLTARPNNRTRGDVELRSPLIGARVCADAPPAP